MIKKMQVFVSSTFLDLTEERQTAVQAILDAGHIPAGMELFKGGKSQMQTIKKWIDNSDIYMLILGGRYGSIEESSGLSYTHLEYRYALSKKMPIFTIILDDNFLLAKAISSGKDAVFEKEHTEKYDLFKKEVKKTVVLYAANRDKIESLIHSQLNDMLHDPDYHLIGWCRADQPDSHLNGLSEDQLRSLLQKTYHELSSQTDSKFSAYINTASAHFIQLLNIKALLEDSERIVELEVLDDPGLIRVVITYIQKFIYIQDGERYFSLHTEMTQQQAESFQVEKLLINNIDYTSQVHLSATPNPNRGQFIYNVDSDFIPPSLSSCDLYFKTSYLCPALDFFQTSRLTYPCNHYTVSIILKNDSRQLYSILGTSFSPFSEIHYDDFKARELRNMGVCHIQLPNWSLPGSGYTAALKRKTPENHV